MMQTMLIICLMQLQALGDMFRENCLQLWTGVKLFSNSKTLLQDDSSKLEGRKYDKKHPLPSSSDSSSEDERLAEASVSHDFILHQSNLPYTTSKKPADIIINQADHCPSAVTKKNSGSNKLEVSRCNHEIKNSEKSEQTKMDQLIETDEKIEGPIKKHKKKIKKRKEKSVELFQ
ncbi:uncharacterized protein LOC123533605 isoform X2 [Mercenaria mercenaria]|uniref:uncharacterized protein LOC123533605 isoform X2 n=1 Tax=Mercenaria mercenaria TaxID=6596 RepID=UPI00234ECE66|nr:uncharacterized protein LOC123533605 isoform X2 [Mercenaria mercenaria]XP_053375531.1 uncharacterized protein LOC123533605 isoform X2 [Mercenaria mercenaria]